MSLDFFMVIPLYEVDIRALHGIIVVLLLYLTEGRLELSSQTRFIVLFILFSVIHLNQIRHQFVCRWQHEILG